MGYISIKRVHIVSLSRSFSLESTVFLGCLLHSFSVNSVVSCYKGLDLQLANYNHCWIAVGFFPSMTIGVPSIWCWLKAQRYGSESRSPSSTDLSRNMTGRFRFVTHRLHWLRRKGKDPWVKLCGLFSLHNSQMWWGEIRAAHCTIVRNKLKTWP